MIQKTRILIVEHDVSDIELMNYELKKGGLNFESKIVQTEIDFDASLKNYHPDIILCDYSLPAFDGPTAFKIRGQLAPEVPFIFVSETIKEENAIELIKNGLTDYALKDKLFKLTSKVKRALLDSKKKKEKELHFQECVLSEKRLARAQQLAHMGNWELDFNTMNVHLSDEACRIYGLTTAQNSHYFDTWLSFIHPEDMAYVTSTIKASYALHDFSYYSRIVHRNGTVRDIYSECKFEFNNNGTLSIMYGIVHDVTERKKAEAEKEKMMADIIIRNNVLQQFTKIVSHNLRAPIVNIQGISSALKQSITEAEKNQYQLYLFEAVENLDLVIIDLNKILQTRFEKVETKTVLHFDNILNDALKSMGQLMQNEEINIASNFESCTQITSLKSHLVSIFYNLISNSIKYRLPNTPSRISITSETVNHKIQLTFKDNGSGINLLLNKVKVSGFYSRFHPEIEGKGFGLFMVKTQVEILGGSIEVFSEPGIETRFVVQLPL